MITVSREQLLNELESVAPGLSPKGVTEQSDCFVFDGGRVFTFNDELSCSCKSVVGKRFVGAVTAAPFLSLLRKLTEDEVRLDPSGGQLRVKGKGRSAGITMEHEVKLDVAEVGKPDGEFWDLDGDFSEGLSMVAECASDDQSEFRYTCVHLTPKGIEATDDYQVGLFKIKTGLADNMLIRKTSARHVVSLEPTAAAVGERWIHFKAGKGLRMACRVARNEDYPDVRAAFPEKGHKTSLPKGLKEEIERAGVFFDDEKSERVTVMLEPGRLRLRSQGAAGWYKSSAKIGYKGDPMGFVVSAKLLSDISDRYSECELSPGRLVVNGGRFRYLATLQSPEEIERAAASEQEE